MVRKVLFFLFCILILAACGESGEASGGSSGKNDQTAEKKKAEAKSLTSEEFEKAFSDPSKYKGSKVDFYAKVFIEPERDSDGTYIQAFFNNNSERNVIIMKEDPDLDVAAEDIIHVKGKIKDVFEGENAFGGEVAAPAIIADMVEQTDYQTAFAPTKNTIKVDEEQDQHGYKLYVEKVEIADSETRVYVKVSNTTDENISFYTFNSKLVLDGKQFETESNYEAEYPEVQSDILPGVDTEGIIVFPTLPDDAGTFQLYFEGSSENWELEFEPFVFDLKK